MSDATGRHFKCTGRDRALFEAGIKLGAVHHQFVGAPLNLRNARQLERAMEEGVKVQPFVVDAKAVIDRDRLREQLGHYGYASLTGRLLTVRVTVECAGWRVRAAMRQFDDIDYPLMYVEAVESIRARRR